MMPVESILIFGGGDNQRTLIRSAKELGYRTVVVDPDPNATARHEAHVFEVTGARDKNATLAIVKKYGIKGIVTAQMENPLPLMAEIAEEMGFIFPSAQSIDKARNKWLMKQAFLAKGVACANGFLIKKDENLSILPWLNFPLIIKPIDSYSSRGVFKVETMADIEKYMPTTRSFSATGEVILEEFMDGPEVSVESITYNGITHIIQITDKIITPYPVAVEMSHIQPSGLPENMLFQIKELVKKAITALELDNCASHAEVKITPEGPKMVEIGARLGGDYISSHLVPLSTGVNMEAATVEVAMGKIPKIKPSFNKGAAIQYLSLPVDSEIVDIKPYNKLLDQPYVKHAMILVKKGDLVKEITDSAKRPGFVIVQQNNRQMAIASAHDTAINLTSFIELK